MLDVAAAHLTVPTDDHRRRLHVWAESGDVGLIDALKSKAYGEFEGKLSEVQRICFLNGNIVVKAPAEGYIVRPLGDLDEHEARSLVSLRAFHPNDPPEEHRYNGWYSNIQRAPLYRRDLDLVAVAPTGELASFCTIWFDDLTRTGLFEPVGTAPEHQRRGLGKALLSEGMGRLHRLGAVAAFVGSYTQAAHALYASVGFEEYRVQVPWVKYV